MEQQSVVNQNICRLCLDHGSIYTSLFDNNAAEMLEALTSIRINSYDSFPTLICSTCLLDLTNAYGIQQKIIQNQKQLEQTFNTQTFYIKREVNDEDFCENKSSEENELSVSRMQQNQIKTENPLSNENFVSTCYERSTDTNRISECDNEFPKMLVDDVDENQDVSDCDEFSMDLALTSTTPTTTIVPGKSRGKYENAFKLFSQWCHKKGFNDITENVLLEYFLERSKTVKSSTLWACYSMVKASLLVNSNIDISNFPNLLAFLKSASKGYQAKKSKTFSREEVSKFLKEAPNEVYLMMKVALILGIAGSCKRDELTNMSVNDIEDKGSSLVVVIPNRASKIQRVFAVVDSGNNFSLLDIYRKYAALRPNYTGHKRFFVAYRNGKCSTQGVGINTFGVMPRKIATWLNLPNPEDYNGHCFRRSPASLLVDVGS